MTPTQQPVAADLTDEQMRAIEDYARALVTVDFWSGKVLASVILDKAYEARSKMLAALGSAPATPTLTQAPAATEAPSKPFAYYIHIAAEQRGEFVHDLDEALDDLTNCECKITELFDRATPAPAVGASVQPAAGALPPVRWWSGVVGSPEKLANLLDGYSEKKESPRRDERVMRAAAKWIREVGASVQPVLAILSDEPVRLALDALEEIALAGMSGTRQESEEGMQAWHARRAWDFIGIAARARDEVRAALASSTPTTPTKAE